MTTIVPFPLKVVPTTSTASTETQECLDLLDLVKGRILAGEYVPTGLLIGIIEIKDEYEESFALSSGLTRMELIGNLTALATEITLEGA